MSAAAVDWIEAEEQIERKLSSKANGATANTPVVPTVSVKSTKTKKRKGESAEEIYKAEIGDLETRRYKKGKKFKS